MCAVLGRMRTNKDGCDSRSCLDQTVQSWHKSMFHIGANSNALEKNYVKGVSNSIFFHFPTFIVLN